MRLNRHVLYMIALTVIVFASAFYLSRHESGRDSRCTVALVPGEGYEILSENPVTVPYGASAQFSVKFDEGCAHDENSGLRYEGGVLYVDNVRDSQSVHYVPRRPCALYVRSEDAAYASLINQSVMSGDTATLRLTPPEHSAVSRVFVNSDAYNVDQSDTVSFTVYEDSVISLELTGEAVSFTAEATPVGSVKNADPKEVYRYGDKVTISPVYDSAYARFNGWSAGASLNDGGTLLSQSELISLTLSGDTHLYANFTDLYTYTVSIDPNGGVADSEFRLDGCSSGKSVYLPADTGTLTREGYALVGYNMLADGSGAHYAPGSPVMVNHDNVTLYAQWLPETPADTLKYRVSDGYVIILGAKQDTGDTLVIPARIDGVRVKVIESKAFSGLSSLKTLVLPIGITYIGTGAFKSCENLETVYLPDTLESMADDAFDKCPSFTRLRVLSKNDVRAYDRTFDAALADKYMRLKYTPGKRIILVAGSSGSFGLDSSLLKARFPDYEIVNFSGSYLFGIKPLMFYVINNLHEGDIVIFAPEYYNAMYGNSLSHEIQNWLYIESNWNMLDELNQQQVRASVLDKFVDFLAERRAILPGHQSTHGVYTRAACNEYGDLAAPRSHRNTVKATNADLELIKSSGVSVYAAAAREITARGGVCLFSFPPITDGGSQSRTLRATYREFTDKLSKAFEGSDCVLISNAADYVFPAEAFYDNKYHMTNEGAVMRTQQLISDLEAWGLSSGEAVK